MSTGADKLVDAKPAKRHVVGSLQYKYRLMTASCITRLHNAELRMCARWEGFLCVLCATGLVGEALSEVSTLNFNQPWAVGSGVRAAFCTHGAGMLFRACLVFSCSDLYKKSIWVPIM